MIRTKESTHVLERLQKVIEAMSRYAVWVGGALTLLSVLLISVEVLLRKFFVMGSLGSNELSSYAFAISTSWSLAYATLQKANVRVDVVYQYLPIRLSAVLDWLSLVAVAIFIATVTYYVYVMVQTSWEFGSAANTTLGTPLWIPQSLWFLGFFWMCLTLLLMLVRASAALVLGDTELIRQLCGVRSSKEEAELEAEAGERIIREERI